MKPEQILDAVVAAWFKYMAKGPEVPPELLDLSSLLGAYLKKPIKATSEVERLWAARKVEIARMAKEALVGLKVSCPRYYEFSSYEEASYFSSLFHSRAQITVNTKTGPRITVVVRKKSTAKKI
jgi:hypothetical protein